MRRAVIALVLVGCATPERRARRQAYYQSHPMAECRAMLREADRGRDFRNSAHTGSGEPQETGPIDPCALGCRIPVCGYPPAPGETAR